MDPALTAEALDLRACGAKRLMGRIAIVTGAGQGIGKATAKRFGAEGASVVVAERNAAAAETTCDLLTSHGVPALSIACDLTEFSEAERVMRETVDHFGRIDILVNVVGGTIWWQPFADYSEMQIKAELDRSLYTTLWCCRASLPIMIAQKSGAIVNISSSVVDGGLYRVPYAASKGGVNTMTRVLAAENGRYGIRVNAVAPGSTPIPDRVSSRMEISAGEIASDAPGTEDRYAETRALKVRALDRTGLPEEQAAAIAFLASDDASYITGQVIACTGKV